MVLEYPIFFDDTENTQYNIHYLYGHTNYIFLLLKKYHLYNTILGYTS